MKIKSLFALLFAVTISLNIQAEPISPEAAAEIAASFVNNQPALRKAHKAPQTAASMRLAHTRKKAASDENAFYVFNRADKAGFIIVSADDRTAEDILGYSDGGADFNEASINPNLRFWLNRYQEEISAIQDNDEAHLQPRKAKQVTAISPLLKNAAGQEITWYQEAPYNNYCPLDQRDNTRSLTGCVATATSAIMYKWQHPAKGHGTHSYTWYNCKDDNCDQYWTKTVSSNFDTVTFNWSNMLPAYEGVSATAAQKKAVASLMYNVGVAANMQYGGDANNGSGAWTDEMGQGLVNYFDYVVDKFITMYSQSGYYDNNPIPTEFACEFNVTRDQFTSYFNADLIAGRPILMGGEDTNGGGHEFVCDGRDANNKFHINWGWEGEGNGYFAITALKPTGTSYNFSTNLDALIGLRPVAQGPDVNVTWMADGMLFDETVASHGVLALPTTTPSACGNGKVFVGWTADEDYTGDDAPEFVAAGTVLDEDATFYAVYAAEEEGGTASVVATMVAANQGYENQQDVTAVTMDNCTLTFSKAGGSNAPKYYTTGSAIRCYKNNTLTISSTSAITSVVFTTVSGYDGVITASEGLYSNGTWTGSANVVTFTNAPSDNSQWRIVSIQVTTGGGASYSAYSTSCSGVAPQPVYYTIRFFDNGEQVGEVQNVLKNQQAAAPADPTPACDDYTFVGWWTAQLAADNTEAKSWITNFKATQDQDYYAIYSKTVTSGTSQTSAEESLTFSSLGKANQAEVTNEMIAVGTHSTITFAKGTGSTTPKYYTTGAAIRAYGGNTVTVAADANMSQIAFTFGSGEGTNEITASTGTYSNGTWTGDAESVVFTIGGTSGHRRFASVAVTLGGASSTTYYSSVVNCNPSDVETIFVEEAAQKVLRDGQLVIIRGEEVYTITGVRIQ